MHWKSVRPAPKITIDYGDGRKLVRTITGNSIHYVLDKNGKILDALPGLYTSKVFLDYLLNLSNANQRSTNNPDFWVNYRNINRNRLLRNWQLYLDTINKNYPDLKIKKAEMPKIKKDSSNKAKKPTAIRAAPLAVTKSLVEINTVRAITYNVEALKKDTSFEHWEKLSFPFKLWKLDKKSKEFIRRKVDSNNNLKDIEFQRLITNLKKYVEIDTVQNEYLFHTTILDWLNKEGVKDVEKFNEKVYSELFLTPKSDKWLGLYSNDIYSAIENNGLIN